MALQDQLLNHFKEKFGIVTVVNATFYAVDSDEPLISFDTLKMSNITAEGQMKEIRGGQGAELLLQYDFGRTVNVEITDALVSMGSLEYLMGGALKTESTVLEYQRQTKLNFLGTQDEEENYLIPQPTDFKNNYNSSKIIVLTDDKKLIKETAVPWISVAFTNDDAAPTTSTEGTVGDLIYVGDGETPSNKVYELTAIVTGSPNTYTWTVRNGNVALTETRPTGTMTVNNFYVSDLDGSGQLYRYSTTQLAATAATLTGGDSLDFAVGTLFYTGTQVVSQTNHVQELVLKATDFPPTVRMVGETLVLDADKGDKIAFQIEIPKLKLDANFTLTLDAEGDPSVFDFSGVALSHNGTLMIVRQLGAL